MGSADGLFCCVAVADPSPGATFSGGGQTGGSARQVAGDALSFLGKADRAR
ncbi:hypothetical protein [Kribbella qitaiheensis]|uniref:hypothetical protein n=1 Tax=Kribbella qitaiheensis TaxID=1544730 RepID=UPI0016255FC3|nr:hypothetical protein [Kribbella qitaiheensis]